ncbi:MAG: nitroreductase family protein [Dethiobacteria bacterium]|jgi:nitroreductase|nr:nitroreductase family protein [Bacillota bacterium]
MPEGTLNIIRERRSVRRFLPKPVPREVLLKLIDCARYAPSAHNQQPWEFVIITDTQIKKTIAELTDYGKFIADAPACIAVFCRETKFNIEDGSAAVTYILLAAEALGLGTCWVAGNKKFYAEEVARILEATQGLVLHTLIPVGYPAHKPSAHKRDLEEMLHWNKF